MMFLNKFFVADIVQDDRASYMGLGRVHEGLARQGNGIWRRFSYLFSDLTIFRTSADKVIAYTGRRVPVINFFHYLSTSVKKQFDYFG